MREHEETKTVSEKDVSLDKVDCLLVCQRVITFLLSLVLCACEVLKLLCQRPVAIRVVGIESFVAVIAQIESSCVNWVGS